MRRERPSCFSGKHQQRGIALGVTVGMRHHRRGDQPVAVLHQGMAKITQLRLLAVALLVQPRIGIGGRLMRLVPSLLSVKVRAIAIVGAILAAKALLRGPGLDQRAVHGEVLVGHEPPGLLVHLGEESLRHIGSQQPIAVLGEHRMVPHRIVHAQAHEPAKQKVVVDLLHQQSL